MARILEVMKQQQVRTLAGMGWADRRIARELGIARETVARYSRPVREALKGLDSKSTKTFTDSATDSAGVSTPDLALPPPLSTSLPTPLPTPPPVPQPRRPFSAAVHKDDIIELLIGGNGPRVIYQALVERHGYAHSEESVKRYARYLRSHSGMLFSKEPRPIGVIHHAPGEEAQVDYFQGALTWNAEEKRYKRPWVFRMTHCHSRHSYEEAVWYLDLHTFIKLHERAFKDFGGAPRIIRHDNTKTGTKRACPFDPDTHDVYEAFLKHWKAVSLPTKPHNPKENGKEERGGGYVKHNAYLKGQHFGGPKDPNAKRNAKGTSHGEYEDGLPFHNRHLRDWNMRWSRTRIHGTTKRQVWQHFLETDKPALSVPPEKDFLLFKSGTRTVGLDSHISLDGAFYPVPARYMRKTVRVRWDDAMVRVYHQADNGEETQVALHMVEAKGKWAPMPGQERDSIISSARVIVEQKKRHLGELGPVVRAWAEAAHDERGIRTYRLLQGVIDLSRKHTHGQMTRAAEIALEKRLFRYSQFKRLIEVQPARARAKAKQERQLTDTHPGIRPMEQYKLTLFMEQ